MARLMSSTELYQKIKQDQTNNFVLIDLRDEVECKKEHIPGAINIPLEQLGTQAKEKLNKNQRVIVYGQTHQDEFSTQAAQLLEALGFRKVSDFDGGIQAWKSAGYSTEKNAPS